MRGLQGLPRHRPRPAGQPGIPFIDAPRLVRGLDYYTRTTYEFDHALLGAQSAIGGGGRYDGLSEDIGGPPLPGIGFAVGLDRTVLAMESERGVAPAHGSPACQVFGVPLGEDAHADVLTLVTGAAPGRGAGRLGVRLGLKGAMKSADRSGAAYAALIGAEERRHGLVRMKDLENGDQHDVAASEATAWLMERLASSTMIRTHEAGTLRASTPGNKSCWPAGSRGGATTAA